MTDPGSPFSSLLRRWPPPASPHAQRLATWRRFFDAHQLVWAPHNLVTPGAAAHVAAEMLRIGQSGPGREVYLNTSEALPQVSGKALIAQAEDFVARGAMPAVEPKPSRLPVGFGLFASEALAAGEIVGEYTGLLVLANDVEEHGAYAYEAWPGAPVAIDACTAGNHTRFVNHAQEQNLDVLQCVAAGGWRVLYVARRNIAAGEELFVDYGDVYWRRRHEVQGGNRG